MRKRSSRAKIFRAKMVSAHPWLRIGFCPVLCDFTARYNVKKFSINSHHGFNCAVVVVLAGWLQTPLSAAAVSLTPVADTYIRENQPDTPQGPTNSFITNLGAGTSSKRWSYLRFDLTGIDVANLKEARLDLWNTGVGGSASVGLTFNIYGLLNTADTWNESALTWNNDPNRTTGAKTLIKTNTYGGVELANYVSNAGGTASAENIFYVTNGAVLNFIKNSPDLSKITFVIYQDVNSGSAGDAWASREDANASHWPTLTLGTPTANTNGPQIIKVYLQGGQSNADGRAPTNGLSATQRAPQSDVLYYYYINGAATNGDGTLGTLTTLQPGGSQGVGVTGPAFGPELTFGRALANYYAVTNGVSTNSVMVAIIKYARGGTSLVTNWVAGGTSSTNGDGGDYAKFQKVVASGLSRLAATYPGAVIELDGMIWVQGETDIDIASGQTGLTPNPAVASAYGTNLMRFIADVRLTYATNFPYGTNLPFYLSRISTNQTAFSLPSNPAFPHFLTVRSNQALVAATMTNVFMIDTDGSQFSVGTIGAESGYGNQHYDTSGQQALGAAFAGKVIGTLPKPQLQPPAKSGSSLSIPFSGPSGLNYFLDRATNLPASWTLLNNIVLGPAAVSNFLDAAPPEGGGFYRVRHN
jgi:hypothetical protein